MEEQQDFVTFCVNLWNTPKEEVVSLQSVHLSLECERDKAQGTGQKENYSSF